MNSLLPLVRRTIRQYRLADAETRVAVALSGGPDSVALAHLVRELDAAGNLRAAGAAHFNHLLRPTANRDELVSADLARSFGWRFVTGREDVASRARREHRSIEQAARAARYAFFTQAREELAADVVALGHTRDDQAETFLLRLLRGAGPRGLAAMHPRHGIIVRPLLEVRRRALRAYLDEQQISYVEDETNRDVRIPRNRVRAELLPLLEARFNPRIVEVLADEAQLARDEWTWMERAAAELAGSELDVQALNAAPLALRRLALWAAMSRVGAGRTISFRHVQAVLDLLGSDQASWSLDVPGQRVQRDGPRIVLSGRVPGRTGRPDRAPLEGARTFFDYRLSIPGEVQVPEAGCVLSATIQAGSSTAGWPPDVLPSPVAEVFGPADRGGAMAGGAIEAVAVVRRDVCRGPLSVRNRRPGDWFRPPGVGGRKKLQDFFVDRKVSRARRDAVPLVVDRADKIVWVAGYEIDEEFRVTDPAQAMLILRLKPLGGPA